jgi:hypothetical protein
MSDESNGSVHWSFWVIGVVALIWNVMGGMNFFMQMDAAVLAAMPESHRAIVEDRPLWATIGFAVTVFGGAAGCLAILFRKSLAYYLFIASLLGVIVQLIHTLGIARSVTEFSSFDIAMIVVMPLVVAALLAGYSKWTQNKGWIN